ncbi:uncharacterized protein TM35_000421740 [Trypanosoma theileri]|uniref:Uncharacterized protein n=1 Tax=Trypanosoma theileri TaxID=67003 RepID=A0A1X0NJ57_9TRYP|nr:uncharacterized protein TM35_000421740 [Trypanosoma theileri]ORC84716.1 hypothetical protein TM35_000421740 [Trypanosoma theileri]
MAYRRKSPPAAQLGALRQLQLLCNVTAMGLPFQAHNAQVLLDQLKVHNTVTFQQFTKKPIREEFFSSRVVDDCKESALIKGAPEFTLPLPKHFIDPSENDENLVKRAFYHVSMIKKVGELQSDSYTPRCGLTGLFFSREEVVDNLQAAAKDMGFKSLFWIRSDHRALGNFLQLKEGSEAICLTLTAAVISVEDVEPFPEDLLHHSLRQSTESNRRVFGKGVPRGMNAFSGFVTKNPFVQNLPNRGVWISQEQFLQNNLQLKKKLTSCENPFVLVEIEQWEMHNADQLTVPGRLALHRPETEYPKSTSIFT